MKYLQRFEQKGYNLTLLPMMQSYVNKKMQQ